MKKRYYIKNNQPKAPLWPTLAFLLIIYTTGVPDILKGVLWTFILLYWIGFIYSLTMSEEVDIQDYLKSLKKINEWDEKRKTFQEAMQEKMDEAKKNRS